MSTAEQLPAEDVSFEEAPYSEVELLESEAAGKPALWLVSQETECPGDEQIEELSQAVEADAPEATASFLPGTTASEVLDKLPPGELKKIITMLERHARHRVGPNSRMNPSDIVAETLISFIAREEKVGNYFKNVDVLTYSLLRMQSNKTIDHYRRTGRNREDPHDNLIDFPSTDPTADETTDDVVFEGVLTALAKEGGLTSRQKRLLFEMVYPGLPKDKLAEELGITVGNLRIQQYRLREKLKILWPEVTVQLPDYQVTEAEISTRSLSRKSHTKQRRK